VLDALVEVQRGTDPTLAFRYACRVGMCGSCGMIINGRERWACRTLLSRLERGPVTVRPLYHFPLIRDLVVDMEPIKRKMLESKAVFVPRRPAEDDEGFAAVSGRSRERRAVDGAIECIGCGMCVSACTMVAHDSRFPGPAALNRVFTLQRMPSAARRSSPRTSSRAATPRPTARRSVPCSSRPPIPSWPSGAAPSFSSWGSGPAEPSPAGRFLDLGGASC